jgi:exodeoxyribonuclease VII small subunit
MLTGATMNKGTESDGVIEDEAALGFEGSLRTVERAVAALEGGALDLDDALRTYERAARLLERCHGLLDAAEQRVLLLTGTNPDGTPQTKAFDAPAE